MIKHIALFISLLWITSVSLAADISVVNDENERYEILLEGEIVKGDYDKFLSLVKDKGMFPAELHLKSNGGDALEAIKLGKLINKSFIKTYIRLGDNCHSSCFILWAGGTIRYVSSLPPLMSKVGIHRPKYSEQYFSSLSISEARSKYDEMEIMVQKYLTDMRIPQSIIEGMLRTPSDRVKLLSSEDINKLNGQDPTSYEWLVAKCGNLTKSEMNDYNLKLSYLNYTSENNRDVVRESFKQGAEKWLSLSEGYRSYLKKRYKKIAVCRKTLVLNEQKKILISIFN